MTLRPALSTHPQHAIWRKPSTARLALLETRARLALIEPSTVPALDCPPQCLHHWSAKDKETRDAHVAIVSALRSFLSEVH